MIIAKNGCHNRRPYRSSYLAQNGNIEAGDRLIPVFENVDFRMSEQCNYTKTDLGKADKKCHGCKWRQESQEAAVAA